MNLYNEVAIGSSVNVQFGIRHEQFKVVINGVVVARSEIAWAAHLAVGGPEIAVVVKKLVAIGK